MRRLVLALILPAAISCAGQQTTTTAAPIAPKGVFGDIELVLGQRFYKGESTPEWVQFDLAEGGDALIIRELPGLEQVTYVLRRSATPGRFLVTRRPKGPSYITLSAELDQFGRLSIGQHTSSGVNGWIWEPAGGGVRRNRFLAREPNPWPEDYAPLAEWQADPARAEFERAGHLLTMGQARDFPEWMPDRVFRFVGVAGAQVNVQVEGATVLSLVIYGPDGRVVARDEAERIARVNFTVPADGMYFLGLARANRVEVRLHITD